jgi:hypothetical protein
MVQKKETTLVKVEGGKNAQEFTQATIAEMVIPTAQEKPESVEELKTQVLELKKRLLAIPQNLDDRIRYFNEKKELIRRLAILNANIVALEEHAQKLHEIAETNDFETEDYSLTVEGGTGSYRKATVFLLKNPVIIGEVIAFMMGRIDVKRLELAAQIEA